MEQYIIPAIFFGLPLCLLLLLGISIYRYVSAKRKNKRAPGSFSEEEMNTRGLAVFMLSFIVGVLLAVVLGLILLAYLAIAYM